MDNRLKALYVHDLRGRICAINQWDGGPVPRFHLIRTRSGNHWRCRADLADELVRDLTALCNQEPHLDQPESLVLHQSSYEHLLGVQAPIEATWSGPLYLCTRSCAPPTGRSRGRSAGVVSINASNARLLQTQMPDWLPDVEHRSPFLAAIENDQAVAVCASVRISTAAHEAGVETHSDYRQQGHATRVVDAWAEAVLATGATPYYSTSWENSASQAVARRLGFELVGVDYHVR